MKEDNHLHCPYACEHPQAFYHRTVWEQYETERYICGVCFFIDNIITEMQRCNPEIC